MSDYVEDALLSLLNQARSNEEIAAHNERLAEAEHAKRTRDVSHLEGLLAHHLRQVAAEPPTQAIPAVPPASVWSQEDRWKPWIGKPVTVTYADGATVTGVLEDTSYRRFRLTEVAGYPANEVYVGSLVSVTDVAPVPPVVAQGVAEPLPADITRPDETPDGS